MSSSIRAAVSPQSSASSSSSGAGVGATSKECKRLYITHVDAFGPYLRICGQLKADTVAVVQAKIQQVLPTCFAIDPNWPVARQQAPLHMGAMCLYKRAKSAASPADCEFVRVRIMNVNSVQNAASALPHLQVEVEFVDYGEQALVASFELLFPQHQEALTSIPPLCTPYILLGICKDFKSTELEEISRMITRQSHDICIELEFKQFKFITMKWKEFNFAEFLIHQKKIGAPITNDLLRDNFAKFLKQQQQLHQQQQHHLQNPVITQPVYAAGGNFTNKNNNYYAINNNNHNINNNSNMAVGNPAEMYSDTRSLSARLQQYQLQQTSPQMPPAHLLMSMPRLPHAMGNMRAVMRGVHMQNSHVSYSGPNYNVATAYNGMAHNMSIPQSAAVAMAAGSPYAKPYPTRYQRPQPAQMLATVAPAAAAKSSTISPPRRVTTATFKSNNLVVGKTFDVCVSFVENGPCLFSIQLTTAQEELTEMMNQIERVQLKQFTEKPMLGTACIARYSEDGQLYRALITGVQPTACKVVYIDYGNAELVKFRDLYEIPDEFLEAKAFAIRFTLSGHKELEPIDESLKKAFKDLMMYKNCKLKVMPLEGPPLVQYCELYLQESNILDVLKEIQKCRLVYPKSETLNNNDIVEIRYIDSPKHFYVQKVSNISKFEELMDDMFMYYNKNQVVPNHLALGAPCIVKYENEWYRAEVMRADSTATIVRHVDFGYEQKVTKNLLSTIAEKHLKLPRQAVQCCLKGFENNELNKDLATNQFEMLAEESNRKRRSFTVKVFRIQPDGVHLVNLCTKDLNVMKKLYKLSMPFEQYLTLEKEEFNVHAQNGHHSGQQRHAGGQENGYKTPSIASSNDVASLQSSKKSIHILNSTALQNDDRLQQRQLQQLQQQQQQKSTPHYGNKAGSIAGVSSNLGSASVEWDKHSSTSSMDNRDSRSSSSEHKLGGGKRQSYGNLQQQQQRQQGRNQQQQQQQMNLHNLSIGSSAGDRRSVGSGGSGNSGYNHKTRGGGNQMPPRFQNDNRRQNKQQPSTPPQQQRPQRPQNAPQGYSQQRQKGGASSASSSRSNDAHSEVVSVASEKQQQSQITEEYVPLNQPFPVQQLDTPSREDVIICWWISPHQFYTHLKARISEFERLMREMQQFYRNKTLQQLQLKVGSYVVARYRKDNVLYRARILACNQMLRKYKVHFVDFGNQYTVTSEDIWQVEKRFASLPCMAYLCSFSGIVSNYDHLYIIDRMEKYLPAGATLKCEYIEREQDMYYVNVKLDGTSLKDTLMSEGIITEIGPELRLSLLAGQQIRVKVTSIRDMLNFKIQIEGLSEQVQLLCCYDDVRYVKSNPDIAQKFKQFYEGKSCVVNIKDVNDNKVILLRPLLPLLKDDITTYICQRPLIMEHFEVRVVYVASAYRLYAQPLTLETAVTQLLNDMYDYYEKNGVPLSKFETEQICAANGSDGNWYRARLLNVKQNPSEPLEVYYIDYGNTEKLEKSKLKQLDQKFYINQSAYAIELNLPLRPLSAEQQHKHKSKKPTSGTEDADAAAQNMLKQLLLNGEPVTGVKALEVRHNQLIAELSTSNGENVIDALHKAQSIKGRDIDFMRKQLDKDKSNMFEYIEMVDLTLEDEDDAEKKHVGKSKSAASPKKKKATSPLKAMEADKNVPNVAVAAAKNTQAPSPVPPTEPLKEPEVAKQPPAVAIPLINEPAQPEIPPPAEPRAPSPAPPSTAPASEPQSEAEAETESIDPYADMEHAILSHCDNPGQFFVHPYDKLDELRKLQENLQIVASSLPPLMSVIDGAYCISLYSVDKQWYRAKIIDAELMVLQFIDYGNTDCVSDTTDVKEMSVFPDIEPLCIPCALPIKPKTTADWVDAANAIFNDSYSKLLNFEYITRGDTQKRSFINLFIDGVNIAERLIEDGFAKPLELVTSGENCYISHVNGLTDFYIQYEKDSKALELIEIYLADNQKLDKLEKFEHSKIVAALFPDDEMWYRAKLLQEVPNQGYEVLFIDYGNTSVSPECRKISEEIAKLPPLSKKCALELPEQSLSWSDAAEEKFAEIAALGETVFTVELRAPAADHAVVHLLIDGHNINDDLEQLCERKPVEPSLNESFANTTLLSSVYESGKLYDAIVSHVNSPSDFYVQFSKDGARLEDMTSSLNTLGMDAVQQPQLDELYAAVFSADNALYRARVLKIESEAEKQYRVIFVDFGNEALTSDLRVLPHDLQQLPVFSKRCQLAGAAEEFGPQRAAAAVAAFNQLIEECEGLVKIDVVDREVEPAVAKLYTGSGEDLGEKLHAILANASTEATIVPQKVGNNTCLISHAISPKHFYVQPKANSAHMEQVMKTLAKANAAEFAELQSAEVGQVCSAYSPEDDCYYRGRVERVLAGTAGYEIFLLDYGNTINTTQIHALPAELCAIPSLAWKCQLNAVPAGAAASLLEERFAALLEAHFGEIYEIEEDTVTEGDNSGGQRLHTVKLQVNYKDLAEELAQAVASGDATQVEAFSPLPTLHDCTIIHVNSPASFYIQLAADVPSVEKITDVLLDAETQFAPFADLSVGAICAAQFPDDLAYYRAQIVQLLEGDEGEGESESGSASRKCEVHYLDFGNNAVTDQFRQLPADMLSIEPYSRHCALDAHFGGNVEAEVHFAALIDSRFSETFQVEFLKTTVEPQICRLFYQDKNVANEVLQRLKGEGVAPAANTSADAAAASTSIDNADAQ